MKRVLLTLLVGFSLVTVAIVGSTYWLLGTENGLRFALGQTQSWLLNNTTQVLNVELDKGTVWDGFSIQSLRFQGDGLDVQAEQLSLQLNWPELLKKKLLVNRLTAKSIQVTAEPSKEKKDLFILPDRMDLPVNIEVAFLNIEKVTFNDLEFDEIKGKALVQNGQLEIQQFDLAFRDTALKSRLNVVLSSPYAVEGLFTANRTFEDLALDAKLDIQGSLERLELTLNALGQDTSRKQVNQSAQAQAVVTPFKTGLLENVKLLASNFNPSQWFDSAPRAVLNLRANVQPNEDFTESAGDLLLQNSAPASLQSGGIPVSKMAVAFKLILNGQHPEQFDVNVEELLLADGMRSAGQARASLQWKAPVALADGSPDTDLLNGDANFSVQTTALDASVFADLPAKLSLNSTIRGSKNANQLRLTRVQIFDRKAELNATLIAGLGDKLPLDLQMSLLGVNPANYMPNPSPLLQGNLNGEVFFKGELAPSGNSTQISPFGQLRINLDNSSLANAPLILNAQATGGTSRLNNVSLDLNVAGNTATANGSYGTQADFVDVKVNLAQLDRLGRLMDMKLAGNANISAKVRSFNGDFSGEGKVAIQQLRLDNALQIAEANGAFSLGSAPDSPWLGDIQVSKIKQPGISTDLITTMRLQLKGMRSQHELSATFESGLQPFSRQRPLKGEVALVGGVQTVKVQNAAALGWKGAITALRLEGMWSPARSFSLQNPAPLTLASGFVELLDLSIKGEDTSTINNSLLRLTGNEVRVQGNMPQFAFPRMSPILRKQLTLEPNNLIAKVDWRYVASPKKVDGHVDLTHVSGGLQVLEDSQIDVDIRTLKASLDFNREAATIDVNIVADEFGAVAANLRLPVEQNPQTKAWGLAGNKPMEGSVAAGFTELNWLGPMISGGVRTSGTGQVAVAIGGTVNNPDVQGRLFAMGLDVFQLDQGVRLEEGNVVVDFTTDKASIDTFEFTVFNRRAPRRKLDELGPLIQGTGKISAAGQWNLSGLDGEIRVNLDRVALLQRPDRWMMLNAQAQVQQPKVKGQPLKIRGQIDTLGAYIEMPESGPQTLGADVFVQGRSEVASAGLPIDLQLQLNLGDRFYLNAEGLRTRLSGGLRLVMLEGVGGSGERRAGRRLSATGTIQTADGTYRAYGQDLTIDRGVVNFQGPLDNPGLNVRAVRKGVAVEAGVEVTGTAQRPKVTLVSEPAVPDSEKLSWMIIGRGSNSADRDATLLLTAAAAIFGDDDESTTRKIAKSVGIDSITLSTGSLTAADSRAVGSQVAIAPGADASASIIGSDDPLLSQRIISLGKRFSDQIYFSFDQSVTTAASILKLNYQYSRRLSLVARAGADNAVDVLYQFSFD